MIFIDGVDSLLSCNKFVFFMSRKSIEVEKNYTWPFILSVFSPLQFESDFSEEKGKYMFFPVLPHFVLFLSHALLLKIEILILIRVCRAQQLMLSFETSGSRHLSQALTSSPSEPGNERGREGEKDGLLHISPVWRICFPSLLIMSGDCSVFFLPPPHTHLFRT